MGGVGQALKRIPLIKFPVRHAKPSGSASGVQAATVSTGLPQNFFTRPPALTPSGKASDQPKRTPVSSEEIEAILLGGNL